MSGRDWDAERYERVSAVQERWSERLLDLLDLGGDETVLDAGCGSGRVTRRLLDRLPSGRVIAVDASPEMAAHAREALGDRATVIHSDLTELELSEQVDAVFSNAVFHWIADHERLFGRLREALRPGGRLVAGCGGQGNLGPFWGIVEGVRSDPRFEPHLRDFAEPWWFPGPEETEERLRRVGFGQARAWLEPEPTELAEPRDFLRTVALRCHLDLLPSELGDLFLDAVLRRCGRPVTMGFVRLQILARA